jgi:hypothetical protein
MTGTYTLLLLVAIILVIRNRKFINKFRDTNTTSAKTAKTLEELNVSKRLLFRLSSICYSFLRNAANRILAESQKNLSLCASAKASATRSQACY